VFIRRRHIFLSAVISVCAVFMLGCSYDTISDAFSEKFTPGAPRSVSASAAISSYSSSNSITVTWQTVNGAAGYYVYRSTSESGGYSYVGNTSSYTSSYIMSYTDNSGLSSGTTYYYKVSAYNNAGESPLSSSSNGVKTRPVAPSGVSAKTQSSGSAIAVSWHSVSGADGYTVYRSTSSYGTYTQVGTASYTSYTDNYTSPGETYYYKVSAYNSSGESSQSSSYGYATTKPAAPTDLYAEAESPGSITLDWYPSTGADGYIIYRGTSASGPYNRLGTTSYPSYTDNSLPHGTTYYYKVSAYNDAGESSQSSYFSATTVLPPPSNVSAAATPAGSITVSWNSVGGVTEYRVYRSVSVNGTYTKVGTISSSYTSYTDTQLSPGTTYYYKVSAYNSTGESAQSSSSSATTIPAAPTNVYATYHSSVNTISVSWDPVNGATGYKVYRNANAYGTYDYVGTTQSTSYTDNNSISSGTTYYYTVSAYNASGDGPRSYESDGATTIPAAPSGVSAVFQPFSGYIAVSWSKVTGATGYKVYRNANAYGAYDHVGTTPSTSYTDNNYISPGTTYYYKVSAYNSAGDSPLSSSYGYVTVPEDDPD
jgi:fibronectin type 3 domain-containing protein